MEIKGKSKKLKKINDELKLLSEIIPKYTESVSFEKQNEIRKEYKELKKYKEFIQRLGK